MAHRAVRSCFSYLLRSSPLAALLSFAGCSGPPGLATKTSASIGNTQTGTPPETSPNAPYGNQFDVHGALGSGYQSAGLRMRAAGTSVVVDRITAVPFSLPFRGSPDLFDNALPVPVVADGSFSITLDKSLDSILLLMNTTAQKRDQIVGYVALGDIADSWYLIPRAPLRMTALFGLQPGRTGRGGRAMITSVSQAISLAVGIQRSTCPVINLHVEFCGVDFELSVRQRGIQIRAEMPHHRSTGLRGRSR